jgi:hypothetical protein
MFPSLIFPKMNTPSTAKMKNISMSSEKTLSRDGNEKVMV